MLWKSDGRLMKTPSSYSDNIEDLDNDSYTSKKTGELIDSVLVQGMIKAEFSWDYLTEQEAEEILAETWKNPMNLTLKIPILGGMVTAPFRCSKRSSEMIDTENNEDTSKSHWKVSFNIMQKKKVSGQ